MNNYKLHVHIAPNGKRYYGITKQKPERRWANGANYMHNQHFARAINKYGWDNIEHIVIYDNLTEDEAKMLEQYMIQWYKTADRDYGYNISLGGDGGNHSEETKKKISELQKGENNSFYGKGYLITGDKHHMYGKHHSEETKKKISEKLKGKKTNGINKHNKETSKPVICLTTKRIFNSVNEGGRTYGVDRSSIASCCKGKLKSAGKFNGEKLVWKYINIIEL